MYLYVKLWVVLDSYSVSGITLKYAEISSVYIPIPLTDIVIYTYNAPFGVIDIYYDRGQFPVKIKCVYRHIALRLALCTEAARG